MRELTSAGESPGGRSNATKFCDIATTPDAQTAGSRGDVLYVVSYETRVRVRVGESQRAVDGGTHASSDYQSVARARPLRGRQLRRAGIRRRDGRYRDRLP